MRVGLDAEPPVVIDPMLTGLGHEMAVGMSRHRPEHAT
jgi:hypothetical protein